MQPMEWGFLSKLVMPGLVPGIHVLSALKQERRGWPGKASGSDAVLRTAMPAMTKKRIVLRWFEGARRCWVLFRSGSQDEAGASKLSCDLVQHAEQGGAVGGTQ